MTGPQHVYEIRARKDQRGGNHTRIIALPQCRIIGHNSNYATGKYTEPVLSTECLLSTLRHG
jgi:hypothetical protein